MLYSFFWVIPRRMNFICRRFARLCPIFILTRLWRWNRQGVPKRRHIKFRFRGITQKKAYKNNSVHASPIFTGVSDLAQFNYALGNSAAFTACCGDRGHTELTNANSMWQIRTSVIMTAAFHRVVLKIMYKVKPKKHIYRFNAASIQICHIFVY